MLSFGASAPPSIADTLVTGVEGALHDNVLVYLEIDDLGPHRQAAARGFLRQRPDRLGVPVNRHRAEALLGEPKRVAT